ncbi:MULTISPECIES: RNA polymerase factor sigma-54 [Bradyrhizobium]|jgi:RNA polymerase sigma-54 factor|uniref:RNA polymerase sigma-54 factor n=2 Tax=Bradyrhizobium TaxID=374 RepID=A0ABS5GBK3_9BRAD|nr:MULTISPECIES: RNA polymerase factor sigma-54 [Bradyrhizobium]RTL93621.1 MAG: RNA polymerase sigma-54 factor [Bradyrhizobiaceae bacterium]ABQ32421.1 RNA polymerase, sigma 54 subunit, RpoN/SigL [Bradyrhizobium sp. BTAi1]MBR1138535.1 RNA polymerase factor sigma-54 [Bradyrhizobium denitrificans]MCL8486596.1 RNA polymerase factor sigma-54 [Bradyrhizobium denitrificans]MDU0955397.1 RNA polymerase factor sigma-54 [Bradyrhizobium sp.]
MALTQRLEFRQSQSLVMTPQLMQAIKLLQLSNLDLSTFVEEELERNPLLERANDGPEAPVAGEQQMSERSEFSDAGEAGGEDFGDGGGAAGESFDGAPEDWMSRDLGTRTEIEQTLDTGLDNVFSEEPAETAARNAQDAAPTTYTEWGGGASGDEDYNLEAFVAAETTLSDHLAEQAAVAFTAPADRMIGQYLIDLVDEAGYLPADLGQAADRLGAEQADVDAVLGVLQTFDPPGICARNLSECLAIQLRELDRYDPAMQALVEHLDILAKRDFASLRKLCGVDDEDLVDMIGEIRRLDPKPGLKFGTTRTQTMVPDVYVRPGPDGGWLVELNSDTLPRVLVNQVYYSELSKTIRKDGDKSYFTDCLQNATWLVRALDQRARTILKVATEIVRQQDGFFTHGVAHLRPLNLKAVADAIQMHESTVSRVTANKYMATNRGTFELKYFFTASIASADGGEAHSAEAVRHHIKQLIDAEDPSAILSDDTIVEKLRAAGIDIARRTVAKYREAMRIPSSVQRRRDKQSMLAHALSGPAGADRTRDTASV